LRPKSINKQGALTKMGAKTLTISMSEEDFNYLREDGLLSASKIFQVALDNIKENRSSLKEQVEILQKKCQTLQYKLFEEQRKNKND
jgi:hypothetical protein